MRATAPLDGRSIWMSVEANKQVVRRLFAEDLSEPDPARRAVVAEEIFAPDFYDPTNPPGMQHGLDGHTALVNLFSGAFPDMRWTVDDLLADGDKVVARTTMVGTHQGEFFGIPPTGRAVTVGGIHILTLRDGKVVLHQGVNDDLGFMRQLGVVPG
jgi:predicted ester cyclase